MKVLLINPIMDEEARFFPLGLGYIAQVLLESGQNVRVLDINAHKWDEGKVREKLLAYDFDVVGITALITQYSYVKWLAGVIKELKPFVRIIVGGGLASSSYKFLLDSTKVDIAVIGEGEITIRELVKAMEEHQRIDGVKGICFKQVKRLCLTEVRGYIDTINRISFPARHLFPMDKYLQSKTLSMRAVFDSRARTTNVISSRGCPYSCAYCYHGIFGHKFRARSAENILAEIIGLNRRYGVNAIMFNDDTFVIDRKRVMSLCDELVKSGLNISWTCNGRTNLMDEELLEKMAESGCRLISYGVESGNQEILNALNRKTTVEQNEKAIKTTWDVGIIPHAYLMVGMFGETKETIRDTVNFCKKLKVGQGLAYATLIPDTPLLERAIGEGRISRTDMLVGDDSLNKWDELGVNLTDIPDNEFVRLKEEAESAIVKNAILVRIWRLYRVVGIRQMLSNVLVLLQTSIPKKLVRGILRQG